MKNSKGFTLLETVIAISIVGVISAVFVSSLTQSLRGQNKANLITQAKQNGDTVLNVMEKNIRGAESIICVGTNNDKDTSVSYLCDSSSCSGNVLVLKANGAYHRYRFIKGTSTAGGTISLESNLPYDSSISASEWCSPVSTSSANQYLTDNDSKTGVNIAKGIFLQTKQSGVPDLITISFVINSATSASSTVENSLVGAGIPFSTTVGLRQ